MSEKKTLLVVKTQFQVEIIEKLFPDYDICTVGSSLFARRYENVICLFIPEKEEVDYYASVLATKLPPGKRVIFIF